MSEPAFDELLRRLARTEVEFVVVGGLALNAWGIVRGTKDVDVVIAADPDNIKRVAEVAVDAGGRVHQGEALLGTPSSIAAALAGGEQVAIETDLGRLDVIQGLDARGSETAPGRRNAGDRRRFPVPSPHRPGLVAPDRRGEFLDAAQDLLLLAKAVIALVPPGPASQRMLRIGLTGRYLNRVKPLASRLATRRSRAL